MLNCLGCGWRGLGWEAVESGCGCGHLGCPECRDFHGAASTLVHDSSLTPGQAAHLGWVRRDAAGGPDGTVTPAKLPWEPSEPLVLPEASPYDEVRVEQFNCMSCRWRGPSVMWLGESGHACPQCFETTGDAVAVYSDGELGR